MPDLWPDDFGTEGAQPPLSILREQAEHLSRHTGGLVLARVATAKDPNTQGFIHRFLLEVPSLDDYVFTLFVVSQPVFLYPLELKTAVQRMVSFGGVSNPAQFEEVLRTVFASPEVRKVVAALKAQAEAAVGPVAKP